MKKIILSLIMIFMVGIIPTVASNNNWSIYAYFADSDESITYNGGVLNGMKEVNLPSNISFIYDTSLSVSFDKFLENCKKDSKEDKKILFILGSGEGVYGIKIDEGKNLSLNDIRESLTRHFKADTPAFELVVTDASLMATAEMGETLSGFAKYLVAHEGYAYEADGYHAAWLKDFAGNTNISAVELGKLICDKYFAVVSNDIMFDKIINTNISLLDVSELKKSYDQYKELIKSILVKLPTDNIFLSKVSKEAKVTVEVGETIGDKKKNLVDYFDFAERLKKYFPIITNKIKASLQKAVIYTKTTPLVMNTHGVSVFWPMNGFYGFTKELDDYYKLANDVCVESLFTYKYNGTIDDKLMSKLSKFGIKKIKDLNFDAAGDFIDQKIEYKNDSLRYKVTLEKELKEVAQDVKFCLMRRYDGAMYLFNELSFSDFDSNNNITVDYNGNWVKMNDVPLFTVALNDTYEYTKYTTPLVINDEYEYYYFSYDGTILKDIGFDMTYKRSDVFGGVTKLLDSGDKVSVLYNVSDPISSVAKKQNASTFTYNDNYKIESGVLPDGEYTCFLTFEDMRGEKHIGDELYFSINGRKLSGVISRKDLFDKNS